MTRHDRPASADHRGARPGRAATAPAGGDRLLEVQGLQTSFHTRDGVVRAVDGIDFHVDRGEILGLVGESGCGKSVTSLSILRLVAAPGRIEAGEVLFDGRDLLDAARRARCARSAATASAMIFQQPHVVAQPGLGRRPPDRRGARDPPRHEAARPPAAGRSSCCEMVGIPDPERRLKALPARDVRRHGPARDDRDGPRLRARAAHRRRADDRPRRDDPGPDPRPDARPPATRPARPSSSSPTTWAWSPRCATGWRSCTPARSSSRPTSPRCSATRSIRTPGA